uniref:AAA family ATPase n=1 Tax=Wolbachia endosymbiont of Pentidionis agamae TaxID=3110435 RepID=UPI002FD30D21
MKKIDRSELRKRIAICLLCVAIIVATMSLFIYLHTILLGLGYVIAADYMKDAMTYSTLTILLFMLWFVYDQVFSKMKEVELPISIELADSDDRRVTFADVVIDDELKQKLRMDFFNQEARNKLQELLKVELPRGYILYGPPGNGKTLIARAIAGESKMNFISISGSDLIGRYIGHGAQTVRELFKVAKKHSPCIIFIDEIDAVTPDRDSLTGNVESHCRESLTQLLVEIDGFKKEENIIVIAATNRICDIDKALIRYGRLSEKVKISNPNLEIRQKILEHYSE